MCSEVAEADAAAASNWNDYTAAEVVVEGTDYRLWPANELSDAELHLGSGWK